MRRLPVPRRRLTFALAVLASVALLFSPAGTAPSSPPGSDKVFHAALFALLTWTGLRARLSAPRLGAALLAYAIGSEIVQAMLPIGRHGAVGDAAADAAGIAVGLAIGAWIRRHAVRR